MTGQAQIITDLNTRLSEELTAVSHYMLHSEKSASLGDLLVSSQLKRIAADEINHSELLIGMILSLQGIPTIAKLELFEVGVEDLGVLGLNKNTLQELMASLLEVEEDGVHWRQVVYSDPLLLRKPKHFGSNQGMQNQGEIMKKMAKSIHKDMLIHASGDGSRIHIGTVVGVKKDHFIKLRKRDMPDGKRRYIPLEWVKSIDGDTVRLSKNAETVRHEWLTKNDLKQQKSIS
jgi:bacterioferritin (cytochrome b1)